MAIVATRILGATTPSGESFRVLGRLDHTWDWPHVELPSSTIGFGSIDEAIARARTCLAPGSAVEPTIALVQAHPRTIPEEIQARAIWLSQSDDNARQEGYQPRYR
ncbi:hypothetical protein BH11GEM1_BH11GEM1_08640 [soil metagenome]